jgi:hypothetical protein
VNGPGAGAASNIVSYEDGGRTLRIDVTADLSAGQTLTLSNVSFRDFNGTSPVDNLELELNNAGTACDEDNNTIVIGGLPTISSLVNQAFTVNDPDTAIAEITVTDAPANGMLRMTRDFRIVIPAAFPMVWNTDDLSAVVTVDPGPGAASTTVSYIGLKILQVDVTADFAPGQGLKISGLSFRGFAAAAVGGALGLDVDLDAALEATDDKTLSIGAPAISSDANQTFVIFDAPTPISRIVIQDGVVARINQTGDLRVRIPSSLAMTFDTTDTAPTFGGAGAAKVAPAVAYEDGGKTLVIDVAADFSPGETLTVQDLAFANFTTASVAAPLELEVNNLNTVAALDDKTKAIGGVPSLSSSASQVFTAGDPATSAGTLVITDAPAVAAIKDAANLRIKIPAATPMTWDTSAAPVLNVSAGAGSVTTVSYEDGDKTLVVEVTNDFVPGQTLTLTGLRFANFSGSSLPASLTLELDIDATPEATDDKTKAVGAPVLLSGVDQKFGTGDPSTLISPITISEDGLTARILADDATGGIRVRIPAGFGMTWDVADTVATIGGAAAAKVSTIVTFEDAGRTLVLDVLADFAPTDAVVISGLSFHPFSLVSPAANLELEVNNVASSVADLDGRTIRVGKRPEVVGAVTGDTNGNGTIDRITVTFDEDVDGTSSGVLNGSGFTLAGFVIPFGQKTGFGTVVFFLPESGIPNTGIRPAFSYDPSLAGGLLDANEGLELVAYGPALVTDGAPPRVVGMSFEDTPSPNGRLNTITFTFSEPMDESMEDVGDWAILDADGVTNLLAGLTDAALRITGNQLVFTLADTTGTTGLPRYRYLPNGNGVSMRDIAGLLLPNQTNNLAPIADAGLDRSYAPTRVTLDGTGSLDKDGQPLTFSWVQTSVPPVALAGASTATPSFVARAAGTYVFELTVSDGLSAAVDSVSIQIQNVAPSADAGVDRTVPAGSAVTLDGSASVDANGDVPLSFQWVKVSGPAVVLNNAATAAPDFTAPATACVLVFEATVSDAAGLFGKDQVVVRVNVTAGNGVPTADAGGDLTGIVGVPLALDGRRSTDPDGDDLTYLWSPGAPLLAGSATATPVFTAAVTGNYTFTLTVTDANGAVGLPDTVRVVVLPAASTNHPPVPNVSVQPAATVTVETQVTMDASASADPEGQTVRYSWVQVGGPRGVLSDVAAPAPTFTPVTPGTYVYQLTETDGVLAAFPVLVEVTVEAAPGTAPTAAAALNPADADGRVLYTGTPFDLSAAASAGAGLTFAWTQLEGPAVEIVAFDTSAPSFDPEIAGTYTFLLVVRDAAGLVDTATLTLVVDTAANESPTASAGADAAASAGATVALDGTSSADSIADTDGVSGFGAGLLAFWRQVSGPAVALSDVSAASPTFVPPAAGTYVFELVVSDGEAVSAADRVTVTVSGPVVAAGGGSSGGGGCGLTGFDALLLLGLAAWGRRRRS